MRFLARYQRWTVVTVSAVFVVYEQLLVRLYDKIRAASEKNASTFYQILDTAVRVPFRQKLSKRHMYNGILFV